MRQSKRLQPICDFKQREEDEAAKILAKAAQAVSQQKQRLSDLQNYRGEYDQQFTQASSEGISAKRMKDYHVFMNNLAQVLEQQKVAVGGLEKDFEDKKRQWLAARNRTKALNKMQIGYQMQEDVKEEKKAQRDQDDRGVRPIR